MSEFTNKIDFAVVFSVKNANPNGDPLNGNRPRETYDGFGEVSDVCLKRKIRNRMMDMGYPVFVQSDEKSMDGFRSLSERAGAAPELKEAGKDKEKYAAVACKKWMDVRAFGQVFAFKSKGKDEDGVSVGVRGPVSIQTAVSVLPVDISSMQITKSVNSEPSDKKSSDTMGMKHRVDFGMYITYGSINHQLAEKTGFSDEDAEVIRQILVTLFENDASSARPDGSMEVCKVIWWKHNCFLGQYSSAKVHRSLQVHKKPEVEIPKSPDDFEITVAEMPDLKVEIYEGN
ncbi:MAG: type I-C CRISPR-associated protein Cas7/Csd2 [bacterium]|nr:type I-C CRISPR-associated protein Cas7/Csd2 [bacterium]MCM1375062.1 type I-C CRISPR-associated protein Cas7/Csd2 [Muribaculum sp.]